MKVSDHRVAPDLVLPTNDLGRDDVLLEVCVSRTVSSTAEAHNKACAAAAAAAVRARGGAGARPGGTGGGGSETKP